LCRMIISCANPLPDPPPEYRGRGECSIAQSVTYLSWPAGAPRNRKHDQRIRAIHEARMMRVASGCEALRIEHDDTDDCDARGDDLVIVAMIGLPRAAVDPGEHAEDERERRERGASDRRQKQIEEIRRLRVPRDMPGHH